MEIAVRLRYPVAIRDSCHYPIAICDSYLEIAGAICADSYLIAADSTLIALIAPDYQI